MCGPSASNWTLKQQKKKKEDKKITYTLTFNQPYIFTQMPSALHKLLSCHHWSNGKMLVNLYKKSLTLKVSKVDLSLPISAHNNLSTAKLFLKNKESRTL